MACSVTGCTTTPVDKKTGLCAKHAKCSKSNCNDAVPKASKTGLCAKHERLKKQEDDKQARQKKEEEKKLEETKEAREQAAKDEKKKQETIVAKKKEIVKVAAEWNTQVNGVVAQVLLLRKNNSKRGGINAGSNGNLITIPGGTDNPLEFALPSPNTYKITKAEVFDTMSGFEGSDSGCFKFRRKTDVFVHGK